MRFLLLLMITGCSSAPVRTPERAREAAPVRPLIIQITNRLTVIYASTDMVRWEKCATWENPGLATMMLTLRPTNRVVVYKIERSN